MQGEGASRQISYPIKILKIGERSRTLGVAAQNLEVLCLNHSDTTRLIV